MSRTGDPHPDYPYELRQANDHSWYSPDVHGHHVYLRSPLRNGQEWSASAVPHDSGSKDRTKWSLGTGGDAHTHMRRIWDDLDPGNSFSPQEQSRVQWMLDKAVSAGSSRREEFDAQVRRTRGLN